MAKCHPVATPIDKGASLTAAPNRYITDLEDITTYRLLIGALQWLVIIIRPDLAYLVSICARFIHNPTLEHWNAAKRIIRYLAGIVDLGLRFGPHSTKSGDLIGWTDSSWADCRDTSRATSGYVFQLWNGPIVWSSKRQSLVSDLSAEVEYIGQANAAKEAIKLADNPVNY